MNVLSTMEAVKEYVITLLVATTVPVVQDMILMVISTTVQVGN